MKKPSEILVPDYRKLALPTKKPGGHVLIDGRYIMDTMRCCHCGNQWNYIKGSGRLRGFCKYHKQVTCGKYECNFCTEADRKFKVIFT